MLEIKADKQKQQGFVLIMVIILVLLISGLGLMAVRHTRQEAGGAGAYVDTTQTIALAQSALAMAVSDLKSSPEYYKSRFGDMNFQVPGGGDLWDIRYAIPLDSSRFDEEESVTGSFCDESVEPDWDPGCIKLLTSTDSSDFGGQDFEIQTGVAYYTAITYDTPLVGPCPPGYSCFDEQNYGWYVFGINVLAMSGPKPSGGLGIFDLWRSKFVPLSRAQGYGRVTIGPIGAYGK